jgi:hypothetical protein
VSRSWPRRAAALVLTFALGVAAAAPAASAPTDHHDDDDDLVLATYDVHGDLLGALVLGPAAGRHPKLAADEADQHAIWDLFARITPPAYEGFVDEFQVLSDDSDTGAFVSENDDDPLTWTLGVDVDLVHHPHELRATLVHEFGHLVSLTAGQVPPVVDHVARAERQCTTYFTGEGCALDTAYIFRFIDRFWGDRLDEWNDLQSIGNDTKYDDAISRFYDRHRDDFVTEYAATDPLEDFAEAFAAYVLHDAPTRSRTRDDKQRFFGEFPELVALRQTIRGALGLDAQDA